MKGGNVVHRSATTDVEADAPWANAAVWKQLCAAMQQADCGLQVGIPERDGMRVRTIDCGIADLSSADVEALDGGPIDVLARVEEQPAPPWPDLPVRSMLVRWGDRIYPIVIVERHADQPGERRGITIVHRDL